MTDRTHQQLLGHLFGVLDDAEQERLDARLERDGELRRELMQWRRRLAPLEALRPDFEPPPGLAARTCHFVAAHMPISVNALTRRWRMSPDFTPPSRAVRVGWCDVAAVALLLVIAGSLLLPAIHSSRFHARLASCQDGLRQFGAALTQYGHHHGNAVSQFANNGRLTPAGVFVAERFQDGFLIDRRQTVCPDVWLAVQGVPCGTLPAGIQDQTLPIPRTAVARIIVRQPPGPQCFGPQSWVADNGPGTWHYGTSNDRRLAPSPADTPLLADAPNADLPGWALESHGGQGRNVLFEDGHIDFVPCAMRHGVVETFLASDDVPSAADISAPIVFVGGR